MDHRLGLFPGWNGPDICFLCAIINQRSVFWMEWTRGLLSGWNEPEVCCLGGMDPRSAFWVEWTRGLLFMWNGPEVCFLGNFTDPYWAGAYSNKFLSYVLCPLPLNNLVLLGDHVSWNFLGVLVEIWPNQCHICSTFWDLCLAILLKNPTISRKDNIKVNCLVKGSYQIK